MLPGEVPRILATDVHYAADGTALAAGVVFGDWTAATPSAELVERVTGMAGYESGNFTARELPALRPLITRALATGPIDIVVVDGHVDLGPDRPGLGRNLFRAFDGAFTVVGVAKRRFSGAASRPVLRGDSETPLWVASTDDLDAACAAVASMHGPHRKPTLLTWVDHLARGLRTP